MLALVAAGRDGGDSGPPVYFTVPWSPSIARKGEMPGNVWASLMVLVDCLLNHEGALREYLEMSDSMLVWTAIASGRYSAPEALGVMLARRTLVELGFFQPR